MHGNLSLCKNEVKKKLLKGVEELTLHPAPLPPTFHLLAEREALPEQLPSHSRGEVGDQATRARLQPT